MCVKAGLWTLDWTGLDWTGLEFGLGFSLRIIQHAQERDSKAGNDTLLTLFQVAFGLLIASSVSVEGSVIEMKPAASEDKRGKPKS